MTVFPGETVSPVPLWVLTDQMSFLPPNHQCQITEGNTKPLTSGLASFFLQPQWDSWWNDHCFLYAFRCQYLICTTVNNIQ